MLSYLDNQITFVIFLFITILLVSDDSRDKSFISIITLLVIINLYLAYQTSQDVKKNIVLFKNDIDLKCNPDLSYSSLKLKSGKKYFIVNKKNGWKLSDDYFIKEPFILRADECSQDLK